jgi:hypothetical protein
MTRDEAIEYILGLQHSVSGEHCIDQNERDEDMELARQALAGLGVSSVEVVDALAKGPR